MLKIESKGKNTKVEIGKESTENLFVKAGK